PVVKEWQSLRLTEETVSKYFNGEPQNLGILLGDASNGLIDIDLDCAQAMALAATFLPPTGLIFGRTSKPASHYEYQVTEGIDTKKFLEPGGSMLVELRANGCQTIFPPSTHPSGEHVRHDSAEEPALVEGEVLRTAVARLAAAALIARHWPNRGARQHTALALGGALLRDGWSLDAAATFVGAIASAAADEEADERVATLRQAEKKV